MNTLEAALEKVVISLLMNIRDNHDQLLNLVTLGKLTDEKREVIYQDIIWTIKTLHPFFDMAEKFIPANSPLQDVMDWCQDIYHQVIEPEIKK
jgi:hypothetical protein